MMNTHVRDNFGHIKTTREATGRITDISSATFGNLSGANLTGVAFPGAAGTFTGGRHNFSAGATTRVRVPVGADKWTGTKGVDARGVWVEGDYLHHIDQNAATEWRYLGAIVSTPAGALAGSLWVEGTFLHYISATGVERRCQSIGIVGHTDVGAIAGSLWIETYQHWIQEAGQLEMPGHGDVAHTDATPHDDTHGDMAHSDTHSDTGHADSHGDSHSDVAHIDSHGDHFDLGQFPKHEDTHDDTAHSDVPHSDSHSDTAHADSHGDSHTDSHADHTDHSDVPAISQPTVV